MRVNTNHEIYKSNIFSSGLPSNPLPYAAAAAAINLSPISLQKVPLPEQCEALNLGKKNQGMNNNNTGENEDDHPPSVKRIKTERASSPQLARVTAVSRPTSAKSSPNTVAAGSPVREPNSPCTENGENSNNNNNNDNTIEMDIDVSTSK